MAYFNQEGISKVVFEGYSDEDDKNVVENINRYLTGNAVERVSAEELEKAGRHGNGS